MQKTSGLFQHAYPFWLHLDLNDNFGFLVLVDQIHQLLSIIILHQHNWTGKGVYFLQLCVCYKNMIVNKAGGDRNIILNVKRQHAFSLLATLALAGSEHSPQQQHWHRFWYQRSLLELLYPAPCEPEGDRTGRHSVSVWVFQRPDIQRTVSVLNHHWVAVTSWDSGLIDQVSSSWLQKPDTDYKCVNGEHEGIILSDCQLQCSYSAICLCHGY